MEIVNIACPFFNIPIRTSASIPSLSVALRSGTGVFIWRGIDVTTGDVVKSFFVENPEPKKPTEKDKKGQSPPLKVDWHCM